MMLINIKLFWLSLRNHPGVPVVIFMHIMAFMAGMMNKQVDNHLFYASISSLAMAIFWIPVLFTAWTGRKQYLPKEYDDTGTAGSQAEIVAVQKAAFGDRRF